MVREGLAATVNAFEEYTVVLEAAHGKELVRAMAGRPDPDIAIVDLHMPVMDGYATITWLRKNRPRVLALALTFDASDEAMTKAIRAGARGFLRKNARSAQLKYALDSLMGSGYYELGEDEQGQMTLPDLPLRTMKDREAILEKITPRELDFLHMVCSDAELTYEQIADHLHVQPRSVQNHRNNLFEKFGIKSKAGLVLFAYKWRIVEP